MTLILAIQKEITPLIYHHGGNLSVAEIHSFKDRQEKTKTEVTTDGQRQKQRNIFAF